MPPDDAKQPSDQAREELLRSLEKKYGLSNPMDASDHWSLTPIDQTLYDELPKRVSDAIDSLIRDRLSEHRLSQSPPAPRNTLIRRVTLDLTGLLPTVQEVENFVDDRRSDSEAFKTVVDRLLASQHYGERWAQHWLDVVRWAETVGFETNAERRNAYHYRDWLIKAFNSDLPYDDFIRHQLTGDVTGQDAALGFLVAGPANLPGQIGRDEEAMRQARQDELDEVIRTVSQSLFGMTIGCARCHDHKFDPITQEDYYSMQAIFAGLRYGERRLRGPLNDEWTAQLPELQQRLQKLHGRLEQFRAQHRLRPAVTPVTKEQFPAVVAKSVRMEIRQTTNGTASLYELEVHSPTDSLGNIALASAGAVSSASSFALANQTRHHENLIDGTVDKRQAFPWVAAKPGHAWVQIDLPTSQSIDRIVWHAGQSIPVDYEIKVLSSETQKWITVAHSRDRMPMVEDRRKSDQIKLDGVSAADIEQITKLLSEIRTTDSRLSRYSEGPQTYAASFVDTPPPTWMLSRGDPMRPEKQVDPSVPKFLKRNVRGDQSDPQNGRELERRIALVRHLTSEDHPLTARVIVNRVWQHHFGTGLVSSSSDFGLMGTKPSHPELLDLLASRFIRHGWSLKWLHREILLSDTYRQSSLPRQKCLDIDAGSRLLWRFPPRRLDAESIRDSVLMASGNLNRQMFGKGFDFFDRRGGLSDYHDKETFDENGWRRMVYAHKIRMQSVDVFGAFDCPDAGQMTPKRNRSVTPLQALGLFNSPFANRQAGFFADRLESLVGHSNRDTIDWAWMIALSRLPTKDEKHLMSSLAEQHGLEQVCRVLLNSSEFLYLR